MLFVKILIAPLVKSNLYLDPGSGSFLLQLLIAALLGGGYALKVYWKKIKAFVTGTKPEETVETGDEEDEQ